ncbi:TonB-dependent receptor [Methyloversatilis thermotolerans]|uniref:TonB-dependent receptor n=1 Tax=Methyloversatilis thermotolerans TaxID=1346290 RepID=UPI00035D03AF|nr:TonB-dependent receptor [Methyloversatilis thermotolerans]
MLNRKNFPIRPAPLAVALATLVSGSPALAQSGSSETVTLEPVVVQPSADASASGLPAPFAGGQVARGARIGVLGNKDQLETPFSVTSYTSQLIEDQQARGVGDVLANDPAVRISQGFANYQELYIIRGFPLYSDDMAYNGLYGVLPRQFVASELLERVEVIRGASTFLNGAAPGGSGIGGSINLLPKRAPLEDINRLTAGVESGGQIYTAADVSRRFGPEQRAGLRVNAARRNGDTGVDREHRELEVLAVGLDYRGTDFRLSADIGHQSNRLEQGRPQLTPGSALTSIPHAPDARRNYSQPWVYSDEKTEFGTLRGEFDLGAETVAWAAVGARHSDEKNSIAVTTLTSSSGATTAYRFDNSRKDEVITGEAGIRTRFITGELTHQVALSASAHRLDSRNAYAMSNSSTPFAGSIYNPVEVAAPGFAFTGNALDDPALTQRTTFISQSLSDTLSIAEGRYQFTLGGRIQRIEDDGFDYNTGSRNARYRKENFSPLAGVLMRITPTLSAYGNYIEGLIRAPAAPFNASNIGAIFAPIVARQREIGLKYEDAGFGGTVALFSMTRPNGVTDPSTNLYAISGEQKHRGVELTVYGQLTREVRVLGGATWLDAELDGTAGGSTDGNNPVSVPKAQYNIGAEWDVPGASGLTLTARAIHTGSQYANDANTLKLDSWSRFDLGARYIARIAGKDVTFRGRVDNVTNRAYWASAGGYPGSAYLVQGLPRTWMLSATVDF